MRLVAAFIVFIMALFGASLVRPQDNSSSIIADKSETVDLFPASRDRANRIVVQLNVNDQGPFQFLLDTGANQSAVAIKLARRLQLEPAAPASTKLHGVTGEATVPLVAVRKLEAGALVLSNQRLAVIDATLGGLDGVLGVDGFHNKRVAVHIVEKQVTIERSNKQAAAPGYATFPLRFGHGLLVVVAAGVAGKPIKAVIDTGSQGSLGNEPLRRELVARVQNSGTPVIAHVQGVTGAVQLGQRQLTSLIRLERQSGSRLDSIQIDDVPIAYGDFYVFDLWGLRQEPALLIGMDILGEMQEIVIDYGRKELQLKARHMY
jgi:hypothetical protein